HGFGEVLRERELIREGSACEPFLSVEPSGVCHPLIDEDEHTARRAQQAGERLSGWRSTRVGLGNDVIRLAPTELPGKFPPQRADFGAVFFDERLVGCEVRADEGDTPHVERGEVDRTDDLLYALREC